MFRFGTHQIILISSLFYHTPYNTCLLNTDTELHSYTTAVRLSYQWLSQISTLVKLVHSICDVAKSSKIQLPRTSKLTLKSEPRLLLKVISTWSVSSCTAWQINDGCIYFNFSQVLIVFTSSTGLLWVGKLLTPLHLQISIFVADTTMIQSSNVSIVYSGSSPEDSCEQKLGTRPNWLSRASFFNFNSSSLNVSKILLECHVSILLKERGWASLFNQMNAQSNEFCCTGKRHQQSNLISLSVKFSTQSRTSHLVIVISMSGSTLSVFRHLCFNLNEFIQAQWAGVS